MKQLLSRGRCSRFVRLVGGSIEQTGLGVEAEAELARWDLACRRWLGGLHRRLHLHVELEL